jgi:hypothetical protein
MTMGRSEQFVSIPLLSNNSNNNSTENNMRCLMAACGLNHTLILATTTATDNTTIHNNNHNVLSRTPSFALRVPSFAATTTTPLSTTATTNTATNPILSTTHLLAFGSNSLNQVSNRETVSLCRNVTDITRELYETWAMTEILYIAAGGDHSFAIGLQQHTYHTPITIGHTGLHNSNNNMIPHKLFLRQQFSTLMSKAVIPMTARQCLNLIDRAMTECSSNNNNLSGPLSSSINNNNSNSALTICLNTISELFSSPSLLASSFTLPPTTSTTSTTTSNSTTPMTPIDYLGLEAVYTGLLRFPSSSILPRLLAALQQAITELETALHTIHNSNVTTSHIRVLLILAQAPMMSDVLMTASLYPRIITLLLGNPFLFLSIFSPIKSHQKQAAITASSSTCSSSASASTANASTLTLSHQIPTHIFVTRYLHPLQYHLTAQLQYQSEQMLLRVPQGQQVTAQMFLTQFLGSNSSGSISNLNNMIIPYCRVFAWWFEINRDAWQWYVNNVSQRYE